MSCCSTINDAFKVVHSFEHIFSISVTANRKRILICCLLVLCPITLELIMAGSSPGRRIDQNDKNNRNGESVTYTSYFESFPIPFVFQPQHSVSYYMQSSNDATKQSRLYQGLLISRRMSALIATYFVRGIKRRHIY